MKTFAFVCLLSGALLAQTGGAKDTLVTGVAGESWLNHLHRPLKDTSMGKTGRLGPLTLASEKEALSGFSRSSFPSTDHVVELHGSDLYRLNCQGCHGESGGGAPPEINSVINPTRATSVSVTIEKMQKLGMTMSRADALQLANQSKAALLDRLHKGGTDMPPFPHLSEPEVRAIFGYLKQLAEIPGAEKQQASVAESPVRVGELVVKSTCHICHSAAGPNPTAEQLLDGAIPPLSTLTARTTQTEFARKVRHGAPIMMGTPLAPYRGRMPVFYYLTPEEAADAYLYLKQYPPYQFAVLNPANPVADSNRANTGSLLSLAADNDQARSLNSSSVSEAKFFTWSLLAEVFVGLLMIGGLFYTLLEVRRLAASKRSSLLVVSGGTVGLSKSDSAEVPFELAQRYEAMEVHTDEVAEELEPDPAVNYARRLHLAEHRQFESSWLSRQLEDKDWVA